MRALLALAVLVAACQSAAPLTTGSPKLLGSEGCFLNSVVGVLVADPVSGTMVDDGAGMFTAAWKPGFTARWTGQEIEVLDRRGGVVAVTGYRYLLHGGSADGLFWVCEEPGPERLP